MPKPRTITPRQRRRLSLAKLLCVALFTSLVLSPVGRAGDSTPSHHIKFDQLSPGGGLFYNYDGSQNPNRHERDWPVTFVFYGNAYVQKVKDKLSRAGFGDSGSPEWEGYARRPGAHRRFDVDHGVLTGCERSRDTHIRLYAPSSDTKSQNQFYDPRWGYFVVGTTHFDFNDHGCGNGSKVFGYSDLAEDSVLGRAARVDGLFIYPDYFDTGNAESLHRDVLHRNHIWQNDGRASAVHVS